LTQAARIASVQDIPPGTGKAFDYKGKSVALFNVGGAFYALDNICPHRGGLLAGGAVEGLSVACPWHGWTFNLETGQGHHPNIRTTAYKVRVEGDDIFIEDLLRLSS